MAKHDDIVKPTGWLGGLNCAIEGILYSFKSQKHVKLHFAIAIVVLLLSLILKLPMVEFVLFLFSVIVLLFAELLNTAVEEVVNLIEDRHHVIAKNAKDVAAGAVLIAAIGVAIMAYMIFSKYLYGPFGLVLREGVEFSGHIAVISLLLVLIAVVVAKTSIGKGTPLHGGMPSGHAAVAFSLATSITLLTLNPLVAILAIVMGLMVSHSRLEGGIHTRIEVTLGALLGMGLTLLIFQLYQYAVK
ncbi:MAG: diacylglycerol kinase [Proteobacteria bacterium]|nr:diacylglycerol kinase [Pseudomonadota bacterium]